jgi:hypothetical protein
MVILDKKTEDLDIVSNAWPFKLCKMCHYIRYYLPKVTLNHAYNCHLRQIVTIFWVAHHLTKRA